VEKREATDDNYEDDEEYEKISDEVPVHLIRNNHSSASQRLTEYSASSLKPLIKLSSVHNVSLAGNGS